MSVTARSSRRGTSASGPAATGAAGPQRATRRWRCRPARRATKPCAPSAIAISAIGGSARHTFPPRKGGAGPTRFEGEQRPRSAGLRRMAASVAPAFRVARCRASLSAPRPRRLYVLIPRQSGSSPSQTRRDPDELLPAPPMIIAAARASPKLERNRAQASSQLETSRPVAIVGAGLVANVRAKLKKRQPQICIDNVLLMFSSSPRPLLLGPAASVRFRAAADAIWNRESPMEMRVPFCARTVAAARRRKGLHPAKGPCAGARRPDDEKRRLRRARMMRNDER